MRIGPPARFAHEVWLEAGKVEHRAQAEQQALAIRLAADASPAPARRRAGRRSARSRAARAPRSPGLPWRRSNPAAGAAGLGLDELVAADVQANVLIDAEAVAVEELEDADHGADVARHVG
jgi:hypothetical protein